MSRPNGNSRQEGRSARSTELPLEPTSCAAEPEFGGLHEIVLHGHRVVYRSAGSGPVVVLVHAAMG